MFLHGTDVMAGEGSPAQVGWVGQVQVCELLPAAPRCATPGSA